MTFREEMAHSYAMARGNGPNSYSQNSTNQKALIDAVKEKINKSISARLDLKNPNLKLSSGKFKIADFGCSVGPNTFIAVQNIIEAIELKLQKETLQNPKHVEFQVFFNDHANNDFNTLFRTLPLAKQYFRAGVPGSFHECVLPKESLHVGHCSYSLHWLSQVPKGIMDPDSPSWNKDNIYCTGFVNEVTKAYLDQFERDFGMFLSARAQELVPGGLMLLLGSCLPDDVLMSETVKGVIFDCLGSCLNDMATSGLISHEELDSFNVPIYFAHVSEFKKVIEENGCFTIEILERVSNAGEESPLDAKLASNIMAVLGGVLKKKFGKEIEVKMKERLDEKVKERLPDFSKAKMGMPFFLVLRRK